MSEKADKMKALGLGTGAAMAALIAQGLTDPVKGDGATVNMTPDPKLMPLDVVPGSNFEDYEDILAYDQFLGKSAKIHSHQHGHIDPANRHQRRLLQ